jgi:hypothetical protein
MIRIGWGWILFGMFCVLADQVQADDIQTKHDQKWNQIVQWADDFEPKRKPAGHLLDAIQTMKQEQMDQLVGKIRDNSSKLLPKLNRDKLPKVAASALADLLAWYQDQGGLFEKKLCRSLEDIDSMALLNLGKLALASASSQPGDQYVAAVLYLSYQLRRSGDLVHSMVGLDLFEKALLLLQNGELGDGPEWKRYEPQAEELFFVATSEAVCLKKLLLNALRASCKQEAAALDDMSHETVRQKIEAVVVAIYPLRSDLKAVAEYFKKRPKPKDKLDAVILPAHGYLQIIEKYQKIQELTKQARQKPLERKKLIEK